MEEKIKKTDLKGLTGKKVLEYINKFFSRFKDDFIRDAFNMGHDKIRYCGSMKIRRMNDLKALFSVRKPVNTFNGYRGRNIYHNVYTYFCTDEPFDMNAGKIKFTLKETKFQGNPIYSSEGDYEFIHYTVYLVISTSRYSKRSYELFFNIYADIDKMQENPDFKLDDIEYLDVNGKKIKVGDEVIWTSKSYGHIKHGIVNKIGNDCIFIDNTRVELTTKYNNVNVLVVTSMKWGGMAF